jgi:hypothetical protein
MQPLVSIKFGSHLYGTSTPASDLDLKGVHLPTAAEILLGRVKGVVNTQTKANPNERNTAEDVDFESFTLQKFLTLAAEGQTVALDMLFAPEWALTAEPSPLWRAIQANRHKLLTRKYAAFVGYCRTQANRYGIRGSRVAAARAAMEFLASAMEDHGTTAKLSVVGSYVEEMTAEMDHMTLEDRPQQHGQTIRHWSVCNKMMPYTASIKSAHETMSSIVRDYGHRALAAEKNEGVDWKAVSHAVRIATQAIELLETGNVVFPRPDAERLVEIKLGRVPYKIVADEIDALLPAVVAAAEASSLPEKPDHEWIDALVAGAYRGVVLAQT